MDSHRPWIAAAFAVMAAGRLVLWQWHVKRDRQWLAKQFGASQDDGAIAETASLTLASVYAFAAVVALYA